MFDNIIHILYVLFWIVDILLAVFAIVLVVDFSSQGRGGAAMTSLLVGIMLGVLFVACLGGGWVWFVFIASLGTYWIACFFDTSLCDDSTTSRSSSDDSGDLGFLEWFTIFSVMDHISKRNRRD